MVATDSGDSVIAAPIDLGAGDPGTLVVGRAAGTRDAYSRDDLDYVRKVADLAGVLVASARLRAEEHRVALRLQQALLPDGVVSHPGVEIAARYDAGSDALEVGGDWYDTFDLPGGRIGLTVGDVVGHGLDAAAAMGRLRIALAALAQHSDSPAQLLSRLDEFATGPNGAAFATACCAILDPATGVLRYASAGHPPMLVVTRDGATAWLDEGQSSPLCDVPQPGRIEASTVLEPGALLILYSDGLVERRRESIDVGLEQLERVAVAARSTPVDRLCDALVDGVVHDGSPDDDVVVVCLRMAPVASGA